MQGVESFAIAGHFIISAFASAEFSYLLFVYFFSGEFLVA
jgi:hypothetical protein